MDNTSDVDLDADVREEISVHVAPASPQIVQTARQRAAARGSRGAKLAVIGTDAAAIALAMIIAAWLRDVVVGGPAALGPVILTGAVALPVWLCVFARYKLYTAAAVTSVTAEIRRLLHAVAAAVACTADPQSLPRHRDVAPVAPADVRDCAADRDHRAAASCATRSVAPARRGQLQRRVVIIGTNAEALGIVQMLSSNAGLGYQVLGLLECGDADPRDLAGARCSAAGATRPRSCRSLGATRRHHRHERDRHPGREPARTRADRDRLPRRADVGPRRHLGRPPPRPAARSPSRHVHRAGAPAGLASGRQARLRHRHRRRAPRSSRPRSSLIAAILIKLDSPGPVFFSQVRIGKDGKLFRVRKLRTMVADAEQQLELLRDQSEVDGPLFKMRDDPRVTRVGPLSAQGLDRRAARSCGTCSSAR